MTVDWKTIDDAIVDWAARTLSQLDADRQFLWEDQNLPQPAYPYVTFKRDSIVRFGLVDETRLTTDLSQIQGEEVGLETTGPREFTLTINIRLDEATGSTDSSCDAMALVERLQGSLSYLSTQDGFCSAGLVFVEAMAVQNLSEEVNGERISRAAMDVKMRATSTDSERTGYIDTVQIQSVPTNPGDVSGVDITIPDP